MKKYLFAVLLIAFSVNFFMADNAIASKVVTKTKSTSCGYQIIKRNGSSVFVLIPAVNKKSNYEAKVKTIVDKLLSKYGSDAIIDVFDDIKALNMTYSKYYNTNSSYYNNISASQDKFRTAHLVAEYMNGDLLFYPY